MTIISTNLCSFHAVFAFRDHFLGSIRHNPLSPPPPPPRDWYCDAHKESITQNITRARPPRQIQKVKGDCISLRARYHRVCVCVFVGVWLIKFGLTFTIQGLEITRVGSSGGVACECWKQLSFFSLCRIVKNKTPCQDFSIQFVVFSQLFYKCLVFSTPLKNRAATKTKTFKWLKHLLNFILSLF